MPESGKPDTMLSTVGYRDPSRGGGTTAKSWKVRGRVNAYPSGAVGIVIGLVSP
jgi:hypothetical protein